MKAPGMASWLPRLGRATYDLGLLGTWLVQELSDENAASSAQRLPKKELLTRRDGRVAVLMSGLLSPNKKPLAFELHRRFAQHCLAPLPRASVDVFLCRAALESSKDFAQAVVPHVATFVDSAVTPLASQRAQHGRLCACYLHHVEGTTEHQFVVRARPDLMWHGSILPLDSWNTTAICARMRAYRGTDNMREEHLSYYYGSSACGFVRSREPRPCAVVDDQFFIVPIQHAPVVFRYGTDQATSTTPSAVLASRTRGTGIAERPSWKEQRALIRETIEEPCECMLHCPEGLFTSYLTDHGVPFRPFPVQACLTNEAALAPGGAIAVTTGAGYTNAGFDWWLAMRPAVDKIQRLCAVPLRRVFCCAR
eukprot:CAMPEP_0171065976 /NCGR_PEP_ID=MMETSP0766_2-20121228/7156_1 /TAXON_ID=439317 /ORGANISM="Gambierdiscus australes, Strain CAWD 149" /LENGTH=365 /DNA_ID=CAMNT_0011522121 /DNA_START=39 /DNA_END=1133 /DNA_ORIENTATION=-